MSLEGDRGFRCGDEALDIKKLRGTGEICGIKPPAPQLGVRQSKEAFK